jgi:hypothetical protein
MRRVIRGTLVAIAIGAGGAVAMTPPALAESPPPPPVTPDGPATLSSTWRGASTAEGRPPEVLQAVTITVGPGSRAGLVRLRVSDGTDTVRGTQLGEWFTLPAEPGRYTFPAPRITIDYRSLVVALDQQTGGHAIVTQHPCTPELGRWADTCELRSLDVWTPILADGATGAPPERDRGATPPTERRPGQQLQFAHVSERDLDRDLAGDVTEDRTDLAVTGDAVRGSDGRTTLTVTNRGPRTADWPQLTVDVPRTDNSWSWARGWTPECAAPAERRFMVPPAGGGSWCDLPALAPGQSHTVSFPTVDDGRPLKVTASAEGPDLADADNAITVVPRLADAPVASLRAPARARAVRGVRLRVRSEQAGTARATLSVRYRGKLRKTTRTLSLRARAARTVVMRPALVRGRRPTGRAALTVTVTAPGSETRTLRRTVRLVR